MLSNYTVQRAFVGTAPSSRFFFSEKEKKDQYIAILQKKEGIKKSFFVSRLWGALTLIYGKNWAARF